MCLSRTKVSYNARREVSSCYEECSNINQNIAEIAGEAITICCLQNDVNAILRRPSRAGRRASGDATQTE